MSLYDSRLVNKPRPITKSEVRIQLQAIVPINPESLANLPRTVRSSWRMKGVFLKTFIVEKQSINTNHKIAQLVFDKYGAGTYNLLILKD